MPGLAGFGFLASQFGRAKAKVNLAGPGVGCNWL
jgi:hypothetical protein